MTTPSGKKFPWSVQINGVDYFNGQYFPSCDNIGLFVKPMIVGKYLVYIASRKEINLINKNGNVMVGGTPGGGAMVGIKLYPHSWGNAWKWEGNDDNEKNRSFILICNTEEFLKTSRSDDAKWVYLKKDNFNKIFNTQLSENDINQFNRATLLSFIESMNQ